MFGWSARDSKEGREALCLIVVALCEMQCLIFTGNLRFHTNLIGHVQAVCLFYLESACFLDIEYEYHQCSPDPYTRPSVQVSCDDYASALMVMMINQVVMLVIMIQQDECKLLTEQETLCAPANQQDY